MPTLHGTQWITRHTEAVNEKFLTHFGVLLGTALWARGFRSIENAEAFLNPRLDSIGTPFRLKDMEGAVKLVADALEQGQKMGVYGDYDIDGMAGLALLVSFLKACGAPEVFPYQPDRLNEGYGVHPDAIRTIAAQGVKVLLTVDTGIGANEAAVAAREEGVKLVITDHHQQLGDLPEAAFVINPNRREDNSGLSYLCGTGVAFYFAMALRKELRDRNYFKIKQLPEPDLKEWLDLFALATVADCVELVGDNRVLIRAGLHQLRYTKRAGLKALIERLFPKGAVLTVRDVGFTLSPKLNAASRLGRSDLSTQLLQENDPAKAEELVDDILTLNSERAQIQAKVFEEAYTKALRQIDETNPPIVVVEGEWHEGVLGIVAAKLVEKVGRPAVVLSRQGEERLRGSMRSKTYFSCVKALDSCVDILGRYGGHRMAAGLQLAPKRFEEFTARLWASASGFLSQIAHQIENFDSLAYDGPLPSRLETDDVERLSEMGPWGHGNPEPLFKLKSLRLKDAINLKGQHLKWSLGNSLEVIGFFKSDEVESLLRKGVEEVEALVTPEINRFRGARSIQLRLQHVRALRGIQPAVDFSI